MAVAFQLHHGNSPSHIPVICCDLTTVLLIGFLLVYHDIQSNVIQTREADLACTPEDVISTDIQNLAIRARHGIGLEGDSLLGFLDFAVPLQCFIACSQCCTPEQPADDAPCV